MKEQQLKQEVSRLQQQAPCARQALMDNFKNLLNVAEYCNTNYLQSGASSEKALEETKSFASQSLASVVYQISTLANSLLGLLDAQTNQIGHMESSINLIGQSVEMHRERVARREIGVSTVMKCIPRGAEMTLMTPTDLAVPRPTAYHQHPIDYSVLDSLGHRYTVPAKQLECSGTIHKAGSSISFGKPVALPTKSDITANQAPPSKDDDVTEALVPQNYPPADLSMDRLAPPTSTEFLPNHSLPPPGPSPPVILEPVEEENVLPPPPAPATHDVASNSAVEELTLPAPPTPHLSPDGEVLSSTRRSRVRLPPPSSRSLSLSLRVRSRHHSTHFLPTVQSLMIPPPPPYPPPSAPLCLPARLQHLDLELPAPTPPPLLDDIMPCPSRR